MRLMMPVGTGVSEGVKGPESIGPGSNRGGARLRKPAAQAPPTGVRGRAGASGAASPARLDRAL
jgi:hypothetical protein